MLSIISKSLIPTASSPLFSYMFTGFVSFLVNYNLILFSRVFSFKGYTSKERN